MAWRHLHAAPLLATLAVASALAGLVYAELATPPANPPPAETIALGQSATVPASPDAKPARPDILARPLFASSRRPTPIDPAATPAATPNDPPHLVGTLMTGRHDSTALLTTAASEKLQAVHEGGTLGRYRIMQISPGEVLVDGPAGRVTLRMGARHSVPQPLTIEAAHNAIGAPDQDE